MTYDAREVALACELITKVRANGHDIRMDHGLLSLVFSVSSPEVEPPSVRDGDLMSFALGVNLTPYAHILKSPERDAIFAEALGLSEHRL